MKRRLGYIVGVVLIAGLILWAYQERVNRFAVTNTLEADYQREFYDVIAHVEQSRVLLGKNLVSGSPRHNILYLTEIWNRATAAQLSLSQLPFTDINTSSSRKFLAQMGDYCFTLASNMANGKDLTDAQYEKLIFFYNEVGNLGNSLLATEEKLASSDFRWTSIYHTNILKAAFAAEKDLNNFVDIEKRIQGLPTLIYDGPFSDHIELLKPLGLEGQNISKTEAQRIAEEFLQKCKIHNYMLESNIEVNGKIPSYSFTYIPEGLNTRINIDISKKGGHIVSLLNSRGPTKSILSTEEGIKRAGQFLKGIGYDKMTPTYHVQSGNNLVVSYAYQQDDVLVYPDLIKIKVALDDGEIIGYEAFSYLMAHQERVIPKAKLNVDQVKSLVNKKVKIENVRKAIIPTNNGGESFTYEIKGTFLNSTYLIYINAVTGEEVQILQVVLEPGGKLAI